MVETVFGVWHDGSVSTDDVAETLEGALTIVGEKIILGAEDLSIVYPCEYDNSHSGYVRSRGKRLSTILIDATMFELD
jgi:hypothetical protein